MKPYCSGPDVDAALGPVLAPDAHEAEPAQIYANTLEVRDVECAFPCPRRRRRGAQFGAWINDGGLDLYTVHGMKRQRTVREKTSPRSSRHQRIAGAFTPGWTFRRRRPR